MNTRFSWCRTLVTAGLACAGVEGLAAGPVATIPAAGRFDHAFDNQGTLYITAGSQVLRYDPLLRLNLPPIAVGGALRGIDVSPNGRILAIADGQYDVGNGDLYSPTGTNRVHLVDIATGADDTMRFPLAFFEVGTYAVAWTAAGTFYVTSDFAGSGWTPMRLVDPMKRAFTIPYQPRQDTMVSASADRKFVAIAEANISSGPASVLNAAGTIVGGRSTDWFTYEVAISPQAAQMIVPTYGGAYVFDRSNGGFQQRALLGQYADHGPVGAAFSPRSPHLFTAEWAWSAPGAVRYYDTRDYTLGGIALDSAPIGSSGNWAFGDGRTRISPDGRWLAVSVGATVRVYDVGGVTGAPAPHRERRVDFNGDGRADLLWQRASDGAAVPWLLNGLNAMDTGRSLVPPAPGASLVHAADHDGDQRADLVWRGTDGSFTLQYLDGALAPTTVALRAAASGWDIAGKGRFDAGPSVDLLWRNASGDYELWLMGNRADAASGAAPLPSPGAGFAIALLADFDGNGTTDILWRHGDGRAVLDLMNGHAVLSRTALLGAGTGWRVTLAPDLDGDGKADLVWMHDDGRHGVWMMDGAAAKSYGSLVDAATGWTAVAAADLDGDGRADLVWAHADGRHGVWMMNGPAASAYGSLIGAGTGWTVACVDDLDGDDKDDLVWTHPSGAAAAWLMDGTQAHEYRLLPSIAGGARLVVPALPM